MPRTPQDVTDAELSVLQELWRQPSASIRELAVRLYPSGSAAHYATVQKLLERLENKAYVRRLRDSAPQRFSAVVAREQLVGRRLRALADKLCGGSLAPLLTHLVASEALDADEVQRLRELIERLDRQPRKRRR